jgi:hypothetical protein
MPNLFKPLSLDLKFRGCKMAPENEKTARALPTEAQRADDRRANA